MLKMSQDPLELFFSSVRNSLGFNNNPTVAQFHGAYKKLCAGALLKTGVGSNCLWVENMEILSMPETQGATQQEKNESKCMIPDFEYGFDFENVTYKSDILTYIAGNTQCKLLEKVDCNTCSDFINRE